MMKRINGTVLLLTFLFVSVLYVSCKQDVDNEEPTKTKTINTAVSTISQNSPWNDQTVVYTECAVEQNTQNGELYGSGEHISNNGIEGLLNVPSTVTYWFKFSNITSEYPNISIYFHDYLTASTEDLSKKRLSEVSLYSSTGTKKSSLKVYSREDFFY